MFRLYKNYSNVSPSPGAFKLLAINDEFSILDDAQNIVDLCAAPGSWSQVASRKCSPTAKIVAVDNQEMAPIPNVICIRDDITNPSVETKILSHFKSSKADVVLCDGAPDVIHMPDWDEYMQNQLVWAGISLAVKLLRKGGSYVCKIYRTKNIRLVCDKLLWFFDDVTIAK